MKISEIRDVSRVWQQFVPIQSISQLLSFIAFYALIIGVVYLITRNEPEVFGIVCTGATVGAFPALLIALPQEFIAEFDSERATASTLKEIDELLRFRGYKTKDDLGTTTALYISKLPAALSWKENSFVILRSEKSIIVRGPKGSVKWLRDRLIR
ncbi:hypothetical protein [Massilia sp.]|uniref:hypothetical protein n=1 Tax=Massilia sp. TaxID=1882437 RepID=UPI00352C3FCC